MSQNQAVANTQQKPIDTVRQALEKMKPQMAMALPRHITPERLCRVAMTAIQQTPKLLDCDRMSLYSAIMRAAQLGLEPDGVLGQAYLIPFKDQVQFIPGYKGLIDLARRSGEVSNIIAKEVCENDDFRIAWHEDVPFHHEQVKRGIRGEVIGFWALARFKDGGFHWDYMTVEEVNEIRDNSSGYKQALKYAKRDNEGNITFMNSPWFNHYIEMGKKTVIRRIAKYLPMSVQKASMVEDLVDANKNFKVSEHGEIIIDHVPEERPVITGDSGKLDNFTKEESPEDEPETVATETGDIEKAISEENQRAAESELPSLPDFDVNAYPLNTGAQAKIAGEALIKALEPLLEGERSSAFLMLGGQQVFDACKRLNQGLTAEKIKKLGVHPMEAEAA